MTNDQNTPVEALTTPTVHLNGTGAHGLREQYEFAYREVNEALKALQGSAPHGRDYYVQDGGAVCGPTFQKARDEHISRMRRLEEVRDELLTLYLAVQAQERS